MYKAHITHRKSQKVRKALLTAVPSPWFKMALRRPWRIRKDTDMQASRIRLSRPRDNVGLLLETIYADGRHYRETLNVFTALRQFIRSVLGASYVERATLEAEFTLKSASNAEIPRWVEVQKHGNRYTVHTSEGPVVNAIGGVTRGKAIDIVLHEFCFGVSHPFLGKDHGWPPEDEAPKQTDPGDETGMAAGDEHPYSHTAKEAVDDLIAQHGPAMSEHFGLKPIGPGDESVYLAVPADKFPPKPEPPKEWVQNYTKGVYASEARRREEEARQPTKPVRYEWPDRVSFVTALSAALAVMAVRSTPSTDGLRTPVETARQVADIIEKIALGQKVV